MSDTAVTWPCLVSCWAGGGPLQLHSPHVMHPATCCASQPLPTQPGPGGPSGAPRGSRGRGCWAQRRGSTSAPAGLCSLLAAAASTKPGLEPGAVSCLVRAWAGFPRVSLRQARSLPGAGTEEAPLARQAALQHTRGEALPCLAGCLAR